jgi:hypothetical protein
MLSSERLTIWDIRIRAGGSTIADLAPSFCGGAGSVTETNLIHRGDDRSFRVGSYTSRKNTLPVSSVSFLWRGPASAEIIVEVSGASAGGTFARRLVTTKEELAHRDRYVSAFDRFSSPKLKVHSVIPAAERTLALSLVDADARPGDFYLLKVEQENGQMAWTSPIWLA